MKSSQRRRAIAANAHDPDTLTHAMETLLGNGVNKAIIDYGRLAGGLVLDGLVEMHGQPLMELKRVLTHQVDRNKRETIWVR